MNGWKDLFAHKRTWTIIIALIVQALGPVLSAVLDNPDFVLLQQRVPYLLAALWTALVLGQAYEDRVTRGASSALTVHRGPSEAGGWTYALLSLVRNEKFVATLLGTVLAIVALCAPGWTGLTHLKETFRCVADLVVLLTASLSMGLAYSSAHDELSNRSPAAPPDDSTG